MKRSVILTALFLSFSLLWFFIDFKLLSDILPATPLQIERMKIILFLLFSSALIFGISYSTSPGSEKQKKQIDANETADKDVAQRSKFIEESKAEQLLEQQNSFLKTTLAERDKAVALFENLFEYLPVLVAIYPNELTSFRVNKKYIELLGWTNEDGQEMDLVEKCFPDENVRAEVLDFVAQNTGVWKELEVRAKNGEKRIQEWCNIKLKNNIIVGIGFDKTVLKQQEQELLTVNDQLRSAQKMAHLSYWEMDLKTRELSSPYKEAGWMNRLTANAPQNKQHKFFHLIHPDDLAIFENHYQRVLAGEKDCNIEYRLISPDKNIVWINESTRQLTNKGEGTTGKLRVTVQDVTQRKQIEEQYRILFENAPFPILVFEAESFQFLQVNQAAVQQYGYSKMDFLSRSLKEILPENSFKRIHDLLNHSTTKIIEGHHLEVVIKHVNRNGQLITVQTIFNRMKYEEKDAFFIFAVDLTDQIETEHKITNAIITTAEKERTEISHELHDSLTQELTIASLNLKNLKYDFQGLAENSRYAKTIQYLEICIDHARSVAHRLYPKEMEDFGLIPSISETIEDIMEVYPVKINFEYNKQIRIDQSYELNIFRVIQEALNNIIKHSKAKTVHIQVLFQTDSIQLNIKDDGIGLKGDYALPSNEGVGLRIIRSRITHLDGALKIHSSPGEGTRISAEFPLILKKKPNHEKAY